MWHTLLKDKTDLYVPDLNLRINGPLALNTKTLGELIKELIVENTGSKA